MFFVLEDDENDAQMSPFQIYLEILNALLKSEKLSGDAIPPLYSQVKISFSDAEVELLQRSLEFALKITKYFHMRVEMDKMHSNTAPVSLQSKLQEKVFLPIFDQRSFWVVCFGVMEKSCVEILETRGLAFRILFDCLDILSPDFSSVTSPRIAGSAMYEMDIDSRTSERPERGFLVFDPNEETDAFTDWRLSSEIFDISKKLKTEQDLLTMEQSPLTATSVTNNRSDSPDLTTIEKAHMLVGEVSEFICQFTLSKFEVNHVIEISLDHVDIALQIVEQLMEVSLSNRQALLIMQSQRMTGRQSYLCEGVEGVLQIICSLRDEFPSLRLPDISLASRVLEIILKTEPEGMYEDCVTTKRLASSVARVRLSQLPTY